MLDHVINRCSLREWDAAFKTPKGVVVRSSRHPREWGAAFKIPKGVVVRFKTPKCYQVSVLVHPREFWGMDRGISDITGSGVKLQRHL